MIRTSTAQRDHSSCAVKRPNGGLIKSKRRPIMLDGPTPSIVQRPFAIEPRSGIGAVQLGGLVSMERPAQFRSQPWLISRGGRVIGSTDALGPVTVWDSVSGCKLADQAVGERCHLGDTGVDVRQCEPGRLGVVVVRTVAWMIVRRLLGVLGCGPTPDADAVSVGGSGSALGATLKGPGSLRRSFGEGRHA
jgi:hypothetical protein